MKYSEVQIQRSYSINFTTMRASNPNNGNHDEPTEGKKTSKLQFIYHTHARMRYTHPTPDVSADTQRNLYSCVVCSLQ